MYRYMSNGQLCQAIKRIGSEELTSVKKKRKKERKKERERKRERERERERIIYRIDFGPFDFALLAMVRIVYP